MINTGLEGEFAFLNNRPLYASISGGKDSTAMGLYLLENNIKFTPIFLDTGWEHESTYKYIKEVLVPLFGEFVTLRNEKYFEEDSEWAGGMEQLVKKNKMFPNGFQKFCTRLLKVVPIQNFYSEIRVNTKKKPINAVGIRAEESSKRAKLTVYEEQDEADVWRPLIDFKEQDIIDLHHKYNVRPNPLYLIGYSRVGCYPCIFARKHEIRHMAYTNPERVDHIEDLEKRVQMLRTDDRKTTFFKSRIKSKKVMDIREVEEWSKTKKGRELDDLEEIEDAGCMRWGLCEHPSSELVQIEMWKK